MAKHICVRCGTETTKPNKTGPWPSYCSKVCQRLAHRATFVAEKRDAALAAAREESRLVRRSTTKTCRQCLCAFTPEKSLAQSFCSKACSSKFYRDSSDKTCTTEGCVRPVRAKALCAKHYATAKYTWRERVGNPETRRASLRRKSQQRRARMKGDTEAPQIDRDDVAEQAKWICGLCDSSVDRTLAWPDPLSASLDHILPLAAGGLHRLDNVQLAHLGCNMSKGARIDIPA